MKFKAAARVFGAVFYRCRWLAGVTLAGGFSFLDREGQ